MGWFFDKFRGRTQKLDPVILELSPLGSKDEKVRQNTVRKLLSTGPEVIPKLLRIIDSRQVEREWLENQKMLEQLEPPVGRSVRDLIRDLNSNSTDRMDNAGKSMDGLPPEGRKMIESIAELEKVRAMSQIQKETAVDLLTQMSIPPNLLGQTIHVLLNAVLDDTSGISALAKKALNHFEVPARPYLLSALNNASPSQKALLLELLGAPETSRPSQSKLK